VSIQRLYQLLVPAASAEEMSQAECSALSQKKMVQYCRPRNLASPHRSASPSKDSVLRDSGLRKLAGGGAERALSDAAHQPVA
jgi:hypothetical protein